MAIIYLGIFIISLIAIKICMDSHVKQLGVHYIVFCILASLTILFYYFLASSTTSEAALYSQIGVFTGMLFIPTIFSNMIHELSHSNGKTSQKIFMIIASIIIAIVITTQYTGLFYKSFQVAHGEIYKEYGPLHNVYYLYISISFVYALIYSLLQIRRKDVSKISFAMLIFAALVLIVSIFLDEILNTGFNFDALGLLISQFFFIYLSKRIPLYDLEATTIEANKMAERTGLIAFDIERRLLGYNVVVSNHVKEFKTLKIDYRLPESFPYKAILEKFLDKVDETGEKYFEIVKVKNDFFSFETEQLLVENKVRGYQIICHNVTDQQNHIIDIENNLLNRNESDKYHALASKHAESANNLDVDIFENRNKKAVILISDISGFSKLTKDRPAKEVINILNDILSFMEECVVNNGGIVDKYVGDSLIAFWDDDNYKESTLKACYAALQIKSASQKYSSDNRYGIDVKVSQGIHTDNCLLGFIGNEKHRDYTVIGDAVDIATRLQSLAGKGQIFVTKDVNDIVDKKLNLYSFGKISLKGKEEPIEVYSLEGIKK